ncbi:hypothetical protein PIB30_004780 [Stylosanthes scabra]|uniref:Uncharacterized protein n=1 Tax=Stylosanthes scabra TaxID=79078 RepID=A0ABU6T3M0_9FABA|nr:hypothetical protein [Stylosanthes scabra]
MLGDELVRSASCLLLNLGQEGDGFHLWDSSAAEDIAPRYADSSGKTVIPPELGSASYTAEHHQHQPQSHLRRSYTAAPR